MKKLRKTSELMWIFGTIFVALGVAICSKANLGVTMIAAPAFIMSEALIGVWNAFSVGVCEYLFQGILLIILCIIIRKFDWKFLFAFLVAVIYGYTLDLFLFVLKDVIFDEVWLRWIMLIVGDVFTALGVACFFKTYLPLQVYELCVSEISKNFNKNINKTKLFYDLTLLVISIILAISLFGDLLSFDFSTIYYNSFHSIGLGTIVITFINAPIITLWGEILDCIFEPTPLVNKFYVFFKGKSVD